MWCRSPEPRHELTHRKDRPASRQAKPHHLVSLRPYSMHADAREMNKKLPPGVEKLTPKILIDMVLARTEARIASGELAKQDADDANYEAGRLRMFRDSALPDGLWSLLAAFHRLGQIDPNMRIARRAAGAAQARRMRTARKAKAAPYEAARAAAVEAEYRDGRTLKATLGAVNKALIAAGHKPTSLTKIHGLLKP
jgi:hypothetical protein